MVINGIVTTLPVKHYSIALSYIVCDLDVDTAKQRYYSTEDSLQALGDPVADNIVWRSLSMDARQKDPAMLNVFVALVERFDAVLFPLDAIALLQLLPAHGWIVPWVGHDEAGGPRVQLKEIPTKGNAWLQLNQENKVLGVHGTDVDEVVKAYRELRGLVRSNFDLAPSVQTNYVEFRYTGRMKSTASPVDVFSRWWSGHEPSSRLGSFLADKLPSGGERVCQYGIRFALSGVDPNRSNWAELAISPEPAAGNAYYTFDLIYRNQNSDYAEKVAESATTIVRGALHFLEGGKP